MLSCRESSRLMSDRLDGPLRLGERFALTFHLAMCRGCSKVESQFDAIRKAAAALVRNDVSRSD